MSKTFVFVYDHVVFAGLERCPQVVREQIKTFVSVKQLFASVEGQPKLVILDEADNMTSAAQFALRRMIEQYASNCRFILICNYSSKIIPALQSRCTKLRFAPLSEEQILGRLHHIADCEKVHLSQDGAKAIVQVGGGDMRNCVFNFATCCFFISTNCSGASREWLWIKLG